MDLPSNPYLAAAHEIFVEHDWAWHVDNPAPNARETSERRRGLLEGFLTEVFGSVTPGQLATLAAVLPAPREDGAPPDEAELARFAGVLEREFSGITPGHVEPE